MAQGWTRRRSIVRPLVFAFGMLLALGMTLPALADETTDAAGNTAPQLNPVELLRAGGAIGGVIFTLSLTMVYLAVEHLLSIRRSSMIPQDLAATVHQKLADQNFSDAIEQCRVRPCFLSHVLSAGVSVIELGYHDVEKSMEDAATEQAARLFRKIEYLHLIGTLAPMLGLLGTVWGMILAFMKFEAKANPAVSELAPGIYRALVTTMMGLVVAVPAFACFALFRNRIDELVAEASLTAEHVFADFRLEQARRQKLKTSRREDASRETPRVPPVVIEREQRG